MSYKKYIKAITELNNLVSNSTEDEIMRYSESDIFWANNKKNISSTLSIVKVMFVSLNLEKIMYLKCRMNIEVL